MRLTRASLTPTRGFFLAALIGATTVGACSLNTQPIPPGAQATADGGSDFGGGGLASDASVGQPFDSGAIATNPAPGDAGDASTDASDEDASDAGDAEVDAADD